VEQSIARSPKYIAILALVSSVILIVGWFARPREIPQSPPTLPSENDLMQLARRAERRSLDGMTTYFATTADQVQASLVRLPELAASGVAWDSGVILTSPLPPRAARQYTVAWSSGPDVAQPAVWGPRLPLAALTVAAFPPGVSPARRADAPPAPGSWVLAIWHNDEARAFAAGTYLQSVPVTCGLARVEERVSSLALHPMMAGGELFDIDGGLLAIILPCGGRMAAISTTSIASTLAGADTLEQRMLARYGLVVGAIADDERPSFKATGGVLVREVWTGYLGDEAGLMPGDVIEELNGEAVASPDSLQPLTGPSAGKPFALTMRRGSKALVVTLPAGGEATPGAEAVPGAGLVLQSPPRGYTIDSVAPGSRAASAGIEPGDRLVRIDRAEPRNRAEIERVFADRATPPVLLEIERGGRRVAILLR